MSPDKPLSILQVCSEAIPFSKTGGLADVAGALPLALGRLGHRVTLVTPRYRDAAPGAPVADRIAVPLGGRIFDVGLVPQSLAPGVDVLLLDCPELYDRDALYGIANADYPDNAIRFGLMAAASAVLLVRAASAGAPFRVVHGHDWPAGLLPVYLDLLPDDGVRSRVARVFTIHNLAYQGLFDPSWMAPLDLPLALYSPEGLEYWRRISFLKAGINYSDVISTVSPTYAREILTPELGFGFDGILAARADRLVGILNGIDAEQWDPARDPLLPAPYGPDDLAGKQLAKRAVLQAYGLSSDDADLARPLVGMISRMVDQKGLDLIESALDRLIEMPAAFVILGSGEPRYENMWRAQAHRYPLRVGVRIGFDEQLSHLIEAGADIFMMPSRFEPCGLNQMYSMRYGTVPVVRATGGLNDTVRDYNRRTKRGTGFKFAEYTPDAFVAAMERALETFRRPDEWRRIQREGMRCDHSWTVSAREYVKVYRRAIRERRR